MKSTGIVRKVDELGRIVLPIELRRTMDIAVRDPLEVYMAEDTVILKPACVFCNSYKDLTSYKGKNICSSCVTALLKKA